MHCLKKMMRMVLVAGLAAGIMACASLARDEQPSGTVPVAEGLRLQGWSIWGGGLEAAAQGNTVTLNGKLADAAGYMSIHLARSLGNKTVILEVRNAEASVFSEERMLKIEVNREDRLIYPVNVSALIHGEYVPSYCDRIEFIVPGDFDGKMNFVFYQAELQDLKITAYYH
jgi:hypothetical protein